VAVLSGALIVGHSVRRSLQALTDARLGRTQTAITSNGFFRERLVPECPLISLEAIVTHDESGRRASRVAVYGVDERFFRFHHSAAKAPEGSDFLLSPALASELQSKPGENILLRVPRSSSIPTESLHGRKEDPGRTIRGTMREVIAREAMGEFALRPQQGPVRAIFVSLKQLQHDLERDGRVNVALSEHRDLRQRIQQSFTLDDVGLRIRSTSGNTIVEHESMVLADPLVAALRKGFPSAEPMLTYLANGMRSGARTVPYSLITAMNRPDLKSASDIVLNEWAAKDLNAKAGDEVELEFYLWDPGGRLITRTARFRVSGIVPVDPAARDLAPEYPGISDTDSLSDWDPPFPIDLKKVRRIDEDYWDRYRATPKAFITLAAGQDLWRTRFGQVTSIRAAGTIEPDRLRGAVDPFAAGLAVDDVRARASAASGGSTDFAEYFLYFSFFLIVSALLLAGLFFRLGIEQRAGEIASLRAFGFSVAQVRGILIREALMIGGAGAVLGVAAAFLYSTLIVTGLRTLWIDAVGTRDLSVHFSATAVTIGALAGVLMGPAAVFMTLRSLRYSAPRDTGKHRRSPALALSVVCAIGSIGLLAMGGPGGFFGAGTLLLASALFFLSHKLRKPTSSIHDVRSLGIGYTKSRPNRTVLCAALIASATFLIVATDAFRRTGEAAGSEFRFFAESAIPVYHDPNTSEGRTALSLPTDVKARWLAFRLRPGDDASCLNLYQPTNPRVLGAPAAFLKPEWKVDAAESDGAIPAAVDANSLTYVLHRKLGDVIEVGAVRLRIVTALHDSIFQSEVVIAEPNFRRAFPEEQGYRIFLIDAPAESEAPLENALSDYGLDITTTSARLAAFHRVENTYLSTFQMLGGLGLVLGTVGLATIVLRNVLERRRELGLLRAVGYTRQHLGSMILAENLMLLAVGLLIGAGSALIAVTPTAIQRGGTPPFVSIGLLLLAVAITGVVASWIAVRAAVRSSFLEALRSE
jgi:putative ABC transport system permease protein